MSSFFDRSTETKICGSWGQGSKDGDGILQNGSMCGDNNSQSDGDEKVPINSREAAEKLMQEAEREYRERYGEGDISEAKNPRGAGRRRIYKEEINKRIKELHGEGMSKRGIAKELGCSLRHVQDVIRG